MQTSTIIASAVLLYLPSVMPEHNNMLLICNYNRYSMSAPYAHKSFLTYPSFKLLIQNCAITSDYIWPLTTAHLAALPIPS